jgi:hypothetical protein
MRYSYALRGLAELAGDCNIACPIERENSAFHVAVKAGASPCFTGLKRNPPIPMFRAAGYAFG